ncbi:MAG: signal peptide peptidase SppA [Wenzhouxiangellaceae bacterium]
MPDRQRNALVRLWSGFWNGLTAFRIAVFNILFLIVLALIIRSMISGDRIIVEDQTTLVISPRGMIVEEYTGTPAERAINQALGQQPLETRLRDLLETLRLAAADDRITQVLLRTDELMGVSPGTLTELDAAFERFRQSGKQVIAYGANLAQGQYALASMADEVWLDPHGFVLIEGLGYFRQYYADALDKLRVDVNLFRVGQYKSAAEPFIRNSMSEADREAAEYWIGGLWQQWLEMVAANRGLPVERLIEQTMNPAQLIQAAAGDAAAAALEAGWVDRLVTGPELRTLMAERGAQDEQAGFRQIDMQDYLALPRPARALREADRIAVVVASGLITEGDQPPGTVGGESTANRLRQAARDEKVKAVLFRIDSGGGSAYASEQIRREMVALRDAGKPVVVSMGDVAASGGYWIAMGANEVWAYPNTITGSIGIFGMIPTFQRTLEWAGIRTDGFGTTPISGAFRVDRALPESAATLLQSVIEDGYRRFITLVAEHRGMSLEDVDRIAQGRVWTGRQAHERGLVDQLGTLEEAIAAAARIAGLGEDYQTVYVEPELSPMERFIAGLGGQALAWVGVDALPHRLDTLFGTDLAARLSLQLKQLAMMLPRAGQPAIVAHCLCEAPLN